MSRDTYRQQRGGPSPRHYAAFGDRLDGPNPTGQQASICYGRILRAYVRTPAWHPIGWYCEHCHQFELDESVDTSRAQ